MPLDNPSAGFNSVAEFQVSSLPWITSSVVANGTTKMYDFACFTKWLIVKNNTASTVARVSVTQNGMTSGNYFELQGGESAELDWRIKRIFVSGSTGSPSVSVIAGLTTISARHWGYVTGSINGTGSWDGVG